MFLLNYTLHRQGLTVSRYYNMIFAIWNLTQTGTDILLLCTLYTILKKHPYSASLNERCDRISWAMNIALVLLVITFLSGVAVIGLASAASAYAIDSTLISRSTGVVYDTLPRISATYSILYFIVNTKLMILAWKASGHSKVRFAVSYSSETSTNGI